MGTLDAGESRKKGMKVRQKFHQDVDLSRDLSVAS